MLDIEVKLQRSVLYDKVSMLSSYVGVNTSNSEGDAYGIIKVRAQDLPLIKELIDLSVGKFISYVDKFVDSVVYGDEEVSINLLVPDDHTIGVYDALRSSIERVICRIIFKEYLLITFPSRAEAQEVLLFSILEEVRKLLYLKSPPRRNCNGC